MGGLQQQRQAIVFADLVESVRLMSLHEADAIARWRGLLSHLRDDLLPRYGGQLVRTAGDGVLLAFGRPEQAVSACHALHLALLPFNSGRPEAELMQLRIGVHWSDVLLDETEAYGNGVNLAARLAALALPSQTWCSDAVREFLTDGLDADIEDLGLRYLKHMAEPARVYALHAVGTVPGTFLRCPVQDLRPLLAIVPFVALPADAAHDALGHALADELIAALSRHPGMRVLSRASTAMLRGREIDLLALQQLHRVVGAAYLLSGRFYVLGGSARVRIELCGLPEGEVLWSDALDTELGALFAGTDELVPKVVDRVAESIQAYALQRVRGLPVDSLPSYSLYLGASGLMNSLAVQDFERARPILEHLAERHPRQAAPPAQLARWHVNRLVQGWSDDFEADRAASRAYAQRALDLHPDQAVARSALALALLNFDRDVDGAREHNEAALRFDPQHPQAWAQLAAVHCYGGEFGAAREAAARSLQLSPLDPERHVFEAYAAMAALASQDYAEAVRFARASVRRQMRHAPSHRLLIGSLWLAGDRDAAQQARSVFLRLHEGGPQRRASPRLAASQMPEWQQQFTEALREARL